MGDAIGIANATAVAALAAITGQVDSATRMFRGIVESAPDHAVAGSGDIDCAVNRLCTRVGLAPALDKAERDGHIGALRGLAADDLAALSYGDLQAWDAILRSVPERIPTVDREPVLLPDMPAHQAAMWSTLLDFEAADPPPWVLVGGQMTALHLAEHGITVHRPTDDGDVVVGVWTRRDALRTTALYLTGRGFDEAKTSDGYGYRFTRGKTAIDVMLPEGLDRQDRYPTTASGRPGLSAAGGNQALTRAERLPVNIGGRIGHVRRPTLLGALVAKAHAQMVDGRDPERHAQDLIALAGLALFDPRAVISQARPDDGRAVRRMLRDLPAGHRLLRSAEDPEAVHEFLKRLAERTG